MVSADLPVTPNGSTAGIAGVCNPEGNVVALMPHPERTPLGDPYFLSIHQWLQTHPRRTTGAVCNVESVEQHLEEREALPCEIFIGTIITNNEERTVERALQRTLPTVRLKQWRYIGCRTDRAKELLSQLSIFNPHKEVAYVRSQGQFYVWNSDMKKLEHSSTEILHGTALLRKDEPDTFGSAIGAESGVCYDCRSVSRAEVLQSRTCEVLSNPHASTLTILASS